MMKKTLGMILTVLFLAGCSQCIVMRSEYYDITGKILASKPDGEEIPIFKEKPDKPCQEIGLVKVLARWGTSHEAMNMELKKRARIAGADALMDVQYGEDRSNDLILCGKLVATRRNASAVAKTVVFTSTEKIAPANAEKTAPANTKATQQ